MSFWCIFSALPRSPSLTSTSSQPRQPQFDRRGGVRRAIQSRMGYHSCRRYCTHLSHCCWLPRVSLRSYVVSSRLARRNRKLIPRFSLAGGTQYGPQLESGFLFEEGKEREENRNRGADARRRRSRRSTRRSTISTSTGGSRTARSLSKRRRRSISTSSDSSSDDGEEDGGRLLDRRRSSATG